MITYVLHCVLTFARSFCSSEHLFFGPFLLTKDNLTSVTNIIFTFPSLVNDLISSSTHRRHIILGVILSFRLNYFSGLFRRCRCGCLSKRLASGSWLQRLFPAAWGPVLLVCFGSHLRSLLAACSDGGVHVVVASLFLAAV